MQFASILKFMLGTLALLMMAVPSQADVLSGYSQITGLVRGSEEGVLPVVEAYNEDLNVAYTVFVVNGHYRAVNLLPGLYRVTIRAAVDQLEGFAPQTTMFDVVADTTVTADFVLQDVGPKLNYAGGMEYADAKIESYDVVFPSGPGRDIFERTCSGCHTAQVFAYNSASRRYPAGRVPKDKAAWGATVDRMHKTPGFGKKGKASLFDPAFLPPADRDILVDYLAEHFPKDGEPRVVQLESEPELDLEALEKAMFIDYIYPDPPEYPEAYPHQVDFDADGNVWVANTKCCMVRFDPRTGDSKAYKGHGGGHGVAVDQTDGTVWYSPDLFKDEVVRRLDPETGLVDHWKVEGDKGLETNTQIFDSKGNLWGSALAPGRLVKWDRATNTIQYWDVPVLRSRPYGIIADHADKIWFADYHNGGVTRFDPDTEVFDHFPVVPDKAAANSMRRPGVDSKNMIWIATWGSRGNDNGALYRLNPDTGDVMERKMGIQYANPYNTEADKDDNIWVASDNYVSMYDQVGDVFTHYPLPVRTDTVKTTISENGGVWFIYRNAGAHAGYNTGAAVLYPDKDKIDTLAAYHPQYAAGYALKNYKGPMAPKVIGGDIISPYGLQNAEEYAAFAKANGLEGYEATSQSAGQKLE